MKAAEGRAARLAWRRAGRPLVEEERERVEAS
jgi:hypothetical protein